MPRPDHPPLDGLPLRPPPPAARLDLPGGWLVLDLARWRDQVADLAGPLGAPDRDAAVELVAPLAQDALARGVAVSAVHRSRDDRGRPVSAALSVGWHDSTPEPATAELVAAVAGGSGLERARVPAGPLVLRRGVSRSTPTPLFPHDRQYVVQALLALSGTCWTAVVTGTSGSAEHAPVVEAVVRRVLLGLRLVPAGPAR